MKTRKRSSMSKPTDQQAQQLCDAIHSLGDYNMSVRAERGHLNIYTDEYGPVARLRSVAASQFPQASWEPMPFAGDIYALAHDLVTTLAPHLQKWDFTDRKSGSGH